jgi:hypothetical protein
MGWRLAYRSALLGVIVVAIQVALLVSPLNPAEGRATFPAAWGDKHALVTAPGEHRIILAGGSNVAFGVDSTRIEQETGRRSVNLGLHAGLGLSMMVNELSVVTRPGDLVVLIPEYEEFFGDLVDGNLAAIQVLQDNWAALAYTSSWHQWRNLSRDALMANRLAVLNRLDYAKRLFLGTVPRQIDAQVSKVYDREAFDNHGDLTAHLALPQNPEAVLNGVTRISEELNPRAFMVLERAADRISKRGGQFIVIFPAVAATYWKVNEDRIASVASSMPTRWTHTTPAEWVYDDNLFYDTHYHLARQGRDRRTSQLLTTIRRVLERRYKNDAAVNTF